MKLYDMQLSGNAHKIRLFLGLLGIEYESQEIVLAEGQNRTEEFLALNPRGQVPVLVDGHTTLWDSQAILVYLARRYAHESWLPGDPVAMAEVMQWMAVAENECLFGLARARAALLFNRPWDLEQCQTYGKTGLKVLDSHLGSQDWLATGNPTIADLACYPYVALARGGEIPLEPYPHVLTWMKRVQHLDGYVNMPGIELIQ